MNLRFSANDYCDRFVWTLQTIRHTRIVWNLSDSVFISRLNQKIPLVSYFESQKKKKQEIDAYEYRQPI